jgi:hypothetical protein
MTTHLAPINGLMGTVNRPLREGKRLLWVSLVAVKQSLTEYYDEFERFVKLPSSMNGYNTVS